MEHEVTLFEIADALYRAGMHTEYKALIHYISERDSMIERMKSIEMRGHDAGTEITWKEKS